MVYKDGISNIEHEYLRLYQRNPSCIYGKPLSFACQKENGYSFIKAHDQKSKKDQY
jgi:hypothetical protein